MDDRRTFTVFRFLWLGLAALVAVFWWRSYRYFNVVSYITQAGANFYVYTDPGRVYLSWADLSTDGLLPTPGMWDSWEPRPAVLGLPHLSLIPATAENVWSLRHLLLGTWPGSGRKTWLGFSFERAPIPPQAKSSAQLASLMGSSDLMELGIPYWFLQVLLGLPLVFWTAQYLKLRRARHRLIEGFCIACGYDLRASPVRCPECGLARPT